MTIASVTAKNKPYACIIEQMGEDEQFMLNYDYVKLAAFLEGRSEWVYAKAGKKVLKKYDALFAEKQKKEQEEKARLQKEKNEAYWAKHADKKKIHSLNKQTNDLRAEVSALKKREKEIKEELTKNR